MTLTIPSIVLPIVLTIAILCIMFRPYRPASPYDIGAILSLLWLIPLCVVWLVYFAAMYYFK